MRALPLFLVLVFAGPAVAQTPPSPQPAAPAATKPAVSPPASGPAPPQAAAAVQAPAVQAPAGVTPPADYVIGPEDQLAILFWRDKDLSAEVAVRPDGRITLPLLNDIVAAGLTPDELRERIQQAASRYVEGPNATVVVKQINSRKVFVTGKVAKPGTYPLMGPTTVLQMIAMAGGLMDFAKSDRIVVMRTLAGNTETFKFNYKDVSKSKNLQQNIALKPGDTILVP